MRNKIILLIGSDSLTAITRITAAFTIASIIYCAALSALAQTAPNPPGQVSLWAAEGGAADSAGTNHGVLHGSVAFGIGKVGQAFTFDGTGGYVEVPDNPSLQLLQEATLMAWVYLSELPSQTGRYLYIAGRSQAGNDFDIQVEPDNRVRFYPCGGAGSGGYTGSTTILQTGVWYHLTATYKANERMELFINGVNEVSQGINCIVASNPSPFTIGWSPVWGRPFHGRIDQVRLFNRVLSTAEIESVYTFEASAAPSVFLKIRVSQVELCWETLAGGSYQLQYSSELTTNRWVPFSTNFFKGTGSAFCTNDVVLADQPQKFYRLVVTNETNPF